MTDSDAPRPEDVDLEQALPEGGMYRQEPERGLPMSVEERVGKLDEKLRGARSGSTDEVGAEPDAAEPELGGAAPPEADPDTEIPDDLERLADDGGETS